jgi:NADH:ubiquinone oxidoreductase subunit H
VFLLAALRALFARLRIDQMVDFSWSWLAPLAVLQLFLVIAVKYYNVVGWF